VHASKIGESRWREVWYAKVRRQCASCAAPPRDVWKHIGFQNRQKLIGKLMKPVINRFATITSFDFLLKTDQFSKLSRTGFTGNRENWVIFTSFVNQTWVNAEPAAARCLLGGADHGGARQPPPPPPLQVSQIKPASCSTFDPHNPPCPPGPNMP
jgi:hypothetical protein